MARGKRHKDSTWLWFSALRLLLRLSFELPFDGRTSHTRTHTHTRTHKQFDSIWLPLTNFHALISEICIWRKCVCVSLCALCPDGLANPCWATDYPLQLFAWFVCYGNAASVQFRSSWGSSFSFLPSSAETTCNNGPCNCNCNDLWDSPLFGYTLMRSNVCDFWLRSSQKSRLKRCCRRR